MPAAPKAANGSPSDPRGPHGRKKPAVARSGAPASSLAQTRSHRFRKRAHLTKAADISAVFDFRRRAQGQHLAVHAKPNTLTSPRLAIMVAKRVAPRAVQRNYMRRVIREVFRMLAPELPGCDVVVRVVRPFARGDFTCIDAELKQLLRRLCPCPSSSSPSSAPTNT
jgi:ribonuclease P protein component